MYEHLSEINFSSAEAVYGLHCQFATEYEAAQHAELDASQYPELEPIQVERDVQEWQAELKVADTDAAETHLTAAAAAATDRIHYLIFQRTNAVIGAQGRLDMVNILARAAFVAFGDDWHEQAIAESH